MYGLPAIVGDELTTSNGGWFSCGESITGYQYQWLRNGAAISGQTAYYYYVQSGNSDVGASLKAEVEACNADGCSGYVQSSNAIVPADQPPDDPWSLSPADGAVIGTTPTLSSIFSDADGQSGYVSYSIYRNSNGVRVGTGSGPWVWSGNASAWTTPALGGGLYYWYAQAGDYSGESSNSVGPVFLDVPPPTPTLGSPAGSATLATVTPVLTASASDSEPISYEFQVATDSGFTNVVADDWADTTTTWTVPPGTLQDGSGYYWRVRAADGYGGVSGWSATSSFSIRLPKLGARDYWPMWSHGPLAVNEANGNLVVSASGPSYPTSAGSMGASLAYNSQSSTDNGFGAGWALNVGDQGASPPTKLIDHSLSGSPSPHFDAVERVSADGSSDFYTHVGSSKTYLSSPGDGSQLTKNDDGTWTLLDPDGAIYTFSAAGSDGAAALKSAELVEASPGKGALTYTFSTVKPTEVKTISDDGGRTLNFAWANASDTGSCTTAILCVSGPDNVTWKYVGDGTGGTSGRLLTVSDGVRNLLQVGYGSNGLVNSVKNANDLDPTHASPNYNGNHALTISYDSSSPARVASVSDGPVTNQTPATSTWSFAYHPGAIQPATPPRASHYGYLVRNDGPLAYYPLDETSGTSAADASVNGNNGTYSGGYTLGQSGALAGSGDGTAVSFSGGMVSCSAPAISTASGAYTTVEMWIDWNGTDNAMPFAFGGYNLWIYGGHFGFNSGHGDIWGTTAPSANTWHYIVAEFYNGALSNSKLWIDGVQRSLSQVAGSAYSAAAASTFTISNVNYPFRGSIDEVAIYADVLSPAEIAAHFAEGMHEPAPVAYYPLDETSGTTAADVSGNGNNGTYSGAYASTSGAYGGSGRAIAFNGGTVSGSVPNLNTGAGGYNTVELWVNWNGTSSVMPFGFGSNYDLYFASGYFGFNTGCGDLYGTSAPSANTWHYVVAEFYNGLPQSGAKLWIDGVQQSLSVRIGTPCSDTVSSNFDISGWPHDGGYRMNGSIDEVAIYNTALSPTEIANHAGYGDRSGFAADGYTTVTPPNQQGQTFPSKCLTTYYDGLGHPIETIDTLGHITESNFNDKDQTLWSEDADGNPTDYLYGGPNGEPSGNPYVSGALLQTIGPDPDGSGPLQRPVASNRYDETQIGTAQTQGTPLHGLQAKYYGPNNTNLTGRAAATETDPNVDVSWPSGPPALPGVSSNYSVRWSGDLLISSPGSYTFKTSTSSTSTTPEGTELTIDGTQAINNWTTPQVTASSQPITLSAGLHNVAFEYYETTAPSAEVHLDWACSGCSPAISNQVIPTSNLLPGWLNQTSTVSPAGRLSFSHYPAVPERGQPDYSLAQVGGTNLITSYAYDSDGRITEQVMPKGNASRTIDAQGNLQGTPDTTYATDYSYYAATDTAAPPNAPDCSGSAVNQGQQLKTATTHGDHTTTYVYDSAGRTLAETNGAGTTCSRYDTEGRLTSSQAPGDAQPTTYTYDPAGAQLTAINGGASYLGEFGHATSNTKTLTKTITLTGTPGAGNAVFLRIANATYTPGSSAVTDSKGNTWVLIPPQGTVGVPNSLYGTFQNAAPLSAGDIVTITFSSRVDGFAGVLDAFSGITSLTPDQSASASDSTGSTARNTGTTGTTTQASELQIASWGINAVETSFTPTTGASQFHTSYLTNSAQTSTEAEYRFVNATGAYNLNAAGGVSGKYNGFIVTLPAIAGGTVTTYYDEQGRLVDTTDSNGAEAEFTYDADGNQLSRTAAKGSLAGNPNYTTNSSYNSADQLTSETDPANNVYSFFYDNRGNLRGTQYPNGTFSWTDTNPDGWTSDQYNRHGTINVSTTTPPSDSSPLADYTYTYNLDGKRLSETRTSGTTNQTTAYSYDNLGRLNQVALPSGTCRNYSYDLDSNRSQIQESATGCNGSFNTTGTYTYDPTNNNTPGVDELTKIVAGSNTTNYTYTNDGQTSSQGTTIFSWDGLGRIRTATVGSNTITYAYDPTGALKTRASSSPSSTLNYLLGDLFETNSSGTITTSYSDGPAGDLASYNGPPTTSSTATYLYYDEQGDLAAETNSSGSQTGNHTYDPFGAPLDSVPTNTTVHRFVGRWDKQYDTTSGLILMGARPYDPTTGRFLSVDPIPGGSLNNYDYAGQDPVNGYDLTGKYHYEGSDRNPDCGRARGTALAWCFYRGRCARHLDFCDPKPDALARALQGCWDLAGPGSLKDYAVEKIKHKGLEWAAKHGSRLARDILKIDPFVSWGLCIGGAVKGGLGK